MKIVYGYPSTEVESILLFRAAWLKHYILDIYITKLFLAQPSESQQVALERFFVDGFIGYFRTQYTEHGILISCEGPSIRETPRTLLKSLLPNSDFARQDIINQTFNRRRLLNYLATIGAVEILQIIDFDIFSKIVEESKMVVGVTVEEIRNKAEEELKYLIDRVHLSINK